MSYVPSVYDIHTKITEIQDLYCERVTTVKDLNNWVITCLQESLDIKDEHLPRTFCYNNCSIEYFTDLLLFSVIKSEVDVNGICTGITYDVAVSVKPYLKDYFGIDHLSLLMQTLKLLQEDLIEVSDSITADIDAWCQNVELVFTAPV